MADEVPIEAIPNQSFSIVLDESRYQITLKAAGTTMAATIERDGEEIISGMRCVVGQPLIPYQYLEGGNGNFFFLTDNNELPYYTEFNVTQTLLYFDADDMEALRG